MDKLKKRFNNKIIPKFIRVKLKDKFIKETILKHYDQLPTDQVNSEEQEALSYLRKNKWNVFPYTFPNKYSRKNIEVFKDESLGLKYIIFEGKRLYFKRKSSSRGIRRNYNNLLIEQDINSPHRYLTNDFNIEGQDILVDVGAAEGNLPLSVIEKVKKVYLFETDERWIEALNATFAPWKDKVEIINKFVSDSNDEMNVALDTFFEDKEPYTFLKIDAEGAERKVLKGCDKQLLSDEKLKIAVCCYHIPNDEHQFKKHLEGNQFSTEFTKGYMIFNEMSTFFPPYLRRGVIRGKK